MFSTVKRIERAKARDLEKLLDAVIRRYSVLYPDWELTAVSLYKGSDKAAQIDRMIAFLQKLKSQP